MIKCIANKGDVLSMEKEIANKGFSNRFNNNKNNIILSSSSIIFTIFALD